MPPARPAKSRIAGFRGNLRTCRMRPTDLPSVDGLAGHLWDHDRFKRGCLGPISHGNRVRSPAPKFSQTCPTRAIHQSHQSPTRSGWSPVGPLLVIREVPPSQRIADEVLKQVSEELPAGCRCNSRPQKSSRLLRPKRPGAVPSEPLGTHGCGLAPPPRIREQYGSC